MNAMLSIGSAGLRAALSDLQGSAARVARAGLQPEAAPAVDLAAEAVLQIQARLQVMAQAQVVKTADTLLGTLVDTFA
ncbi:MAG: hypothetical protein IT501_06340 [Rubrivivax sp.]|nr:hypothetical protein [Rubrivivax sp.]